MVEASIWNNYSWIPKETENDQSEDSLRVLPPFNGPSEGGATLPPSLGSGADDGTGEASSDTDEQGSGRPD